MEAELLKLSAINAYYIGAELSIERANIGIDVVSLELCL